MKNKNSTKPYYVPQGIQKFFAAVIIGFFLVQLAFTLVSSIQQYQQNAEVGGLYAFLFTHQLFPILIFITTYFLNPRKLRLVSRIFETLLITIAALIGWSSLFMFIPWPEFLGVDDAGSYYIYQLFLAVFYLSIILLSLGWLRKSGKWR